MKCSQVVQGTNEMLKEYQMRWFQQQMRFPHITNEMIERDVFTRCWRVKSSGRHACEACLQDKVIAMITRSLRPSSCPINSRQK